MVLMATGMPIFLCFLVIDIIGLFLVGGGLPNLEYLTVSFFEFLSSFLLLPILLFILMGDVMFTGGVSSSDDRCSR